MRHIACFLLLLVSSASASEPACGKGSSAPVCTSDESCCMDSPGCTGLCTECCNNQLTTCVLPRGSYQTSTCCPKWTVPCTVGTVGCCDPARPWQSSSEGGFTAVETHRADAFLTPADAVRRQPNLRRGAQPESAAAVAEAEMMKSVKAAAAAAAAAAASAASGARSGKRNATAYAIFTNALTGGLMASTIDAGSGAVTATAKISGPAGDYFESYFGQAPRILPWDPKTRKFYIADVDAAASKNATAITLYAIDPSDGSSTSKAVSGCEGYPTGLAFDVAAARLVLAVQDASSVTFCTVDPSSGAARASPALARGADESDSSYYGAYVSHANAGVAVRVGHKLVSKGSDLGVGRVPLGHPLGSAGERDGNAGEYSGAGAVLKSDWSDLDLGSHDLPAATRAHPSGKGYLALAPRKGSNGKTLDMVAWGDTAGPARVIANLTNANVPGFAHAQLGYVTDALAGESLYGAMTVALHPFPILPGVRDKWTITILDLATAALTETPLNPQPSFEGANTVSLGGFGLVAA